MRHVETSPGTNLEELEQQNDNIILHYNPKKTINSHEPVPI